jgi:hypothetical protein
MVQPQSILSTALIKGFIKGDIASSPFVFVSTTFLKK